MYKQTIWVNIILVILLIIILILAIIGCVDTHRKPWRERGRVIAHEKVQGIEFKRLY